MLSAIALLLVVLCPSLAIASDSWHAGAAKEKITPQQFMSMAGYGSRNHPATGLLNDLWAKALVLEDAHGKRVAVITLDLVGISPDVADPLTAELAEKFKLPRANIAICCSHTHSGPVVGHNLRTLHYDQLEKSQQQLVDQYAVQLRGQIVALVGRAIEALVPCQVSYGTGKATFGVNRRNNPEAEAPERRAAGTLVGPSDPDVPVLKVSDPQGNLKAVLFGYACHATVLSDYDWSSDYPGFAQTEIENRHPDCVALFFAGCGADQNPLPRRKVELAKQYGQELAGVVEKVLDESLTPVSPRVRVGYTTIPLELAHVPNNEELEAEAASSDRYVSARAKHFLERLREGSKIPDTYAYPVQAWRLGADLTFVTLGGEVVVDYALRLKSEHGTDKTWVAGYTNDVMAYIPSRRVLAEGGYEGGGAMVYYSLPSPWKPTIEEAIIKAVRGTIPNP
jgi:hypothetical protein